MQPELVFRHNHNTFAESTSSADAANATEGFPTPLYTSGLYSTNGFMKHRVTHNICLVDNNLMKDNYLIQNESDTDVSFDILIPQIASLASEPEKLYNFYAHAYDTTDSDALKLLDLFADTDAASFEESSYYSPLFSANGLGESTLTLDELYQGQIYNTPQSQRIRVSSITCQGLSLILSLMKKYVCLSQGLVTAAIFIRLAAAIPQQTMAMSFLAEVKISLTCYVS